MTKAIGALPDEAAWEAAYAPYDPDTYAAALAHLRPEDVIVDIGAGDLRFARQAAARCRYVYAVERRGDLVVAADRPWPANLEVQVGDALAWPIPAGVTAGVLLMRHCRHYRAYAGKVRAAGGDRLITNARWRLGVECVDLSGPRVSYAALAGAWYACDCGAVGLAPGPVERVQEDEVIQAVVDCPACGDNFNQVRGDHAAQR